MQSLEDLFGCRVIVNPQLVHQKRAVRLDDGLHISPAMCDLLAEADEQEFPAMVKAIHIADMRGAKWRMVTESQLDKGFRVHWPDMESITNGRYDVVFDCGNGTYAVREPELTHDP